jgi:hypothetical protein
MTNKPTHTRTRTNTNTHTHTHTRITNRIQFTLTGPWNNNTCNLKAKRISSDARLIAEMSICRNKTKTELEKKDNE